MSEPPPSDDVSEYFDTDAQPFDSIRFQPEPASINIAPSSHIHESIQHPATIHPRTSFGTASVYNANPTPPADEDLLSFASPTAPAQQRVQHHPSTSNNITPGGFSVA